MHDSRLVSFDAAALHYLQTGNNVGEVDYKVGDFLRREKKIWIMDDEKGCLREQKKSFWFIWFIEMLLDVHICAAFFFLF